jgi:hypothetical protein
LTWKPAFIISADEGKYFENDSAMKITDQAIAYHIPAPCWRCIHWDTTDPDPPGKCCTLAGIESYGVN